MPATIATTLVCPNCGSGRVHRVKHPSLFVKLSERVGLRVYRCETCSRRFRDWLEWLGDTDD